MTRSDVMASLSSRGWSSSHRVSQPPGAPRDGKQKTRHIKVILLGDMSVGKTSLLHRFTEGKFSEAYKATITLEHVEKEVHLDGRTFILRIVDTAGQDRFKSLTQNFYRGTQICLLTFALDSFSSFCNLSRWREEFLHFSGVDMACDFPFVVVGNKADIEHSQRAVKAISAQAWCESIDSAPYIETSAKTAHNVDDLFLTAVKRMTELEKLGRSPVTDVSQRGRDIVVPGAYIEPYFKRRSKCCD